MRLDEFLETYHATDEEVKNLKFVNIRGCNGSGKTTVIKEMMKYSNHFEVTETINNKCTVICTVFPEFNFLSFGSYTRDCGGCDVFSKFKPEFESMVAFYDHFLDKFWNVKFNIIMEGVIISTINSTYSELFRKYQDRNTREVIGYFFTTPLEVCKERVLSRNKGKEISEKLLRRKRNSVLRGANIFEEHGLKAVECDNSSFAIEDTLPKFFESINVPLYDYKNFVKDDDEW